MTHDDGRDPSSTGPAQRSPRSTRTVVLAAAAVVVVVLVGGGLGAAHLLQDEPAVAPAAAGPTSPVATTTTATTAATTTPAPTSPLPTSTPVPTTTSAPVPSTPAATTPVYPPAFTDFQLNGYEQLWAVYVAVGEIGDPAVAAARERLAEVGYSSSSSTLGCDQGASEALGLDPALDSAAVYFETQEQAEQLVALWGEPVVGSVEITVGCNDGA